MHLLHSMDVQLTASYVALAWAVGFYITECIHDSPWIMSWDASWLLFTMSCYRKRKEFQELCGEGSSCSTGGRHSCCRQGWWVPTSLFVADKLLIQIAEENSVMICLLRAFHTSQRVRGGRWSVPQARAPCRRYQGAHGSGFAHSNERHILDDQILKGPGKNWLAKRVAPGHTFAPSRTRPSRALCLVKAFIPYEKGHLGLCFMPVQTQVRISKCIHTDWRACSWAIRALGGLGALASVI